MISVSLGNLGLCSLIDGDIYLDQLLGFPSLKTNEICRFVFVYISTN